jgi:prevent-host-death family protein
MQKVGIRELKNKLSHYLNQVEEGKRYELTKRGEVIALLIPVQEEKMYTGLRALIEEGQASWTGDKPTGASHPVKHRGRPLSEIIIQDRG